MRTSSRAETSRGRVAFLWDESFLWGVMAYKALTTTGIPFDLIRAVDVAKGDLEGFGTLFVPGGWASNKLKALGEDGTNAIRRFVEQGGTYIGFCGGAGLATRDGIGLLPVKRRPTKERVPSFSGGIRLSLAESSLWHGISDPVFHAWWPSQFVVDGEVNVIATYDDPLPDAFSSDVNIGDANAAGDWRSLEEWYGILLDPARLCGEPAVIEGRCGSGRVVLSLVHFDTPDDSNGTRVLQNLWRSAGAEARPGAGSDPVPAKMEGYRTAGSTLGRLVAAVDGLIGLGTRNFLWFPRNPLILQWRRGVRGLEYCTLSVMVHEIERLFSERGATEGFDDRLENMWDRARVFCTDAAELLVRERFAMQRTSITYERCDDAEIQSLRDRLFSRAKSYGGMFKELVDGLDEVLYSLLCEKRKR